MVKEEVFVGQGFSLAFKLLQMIDGFFCKPKGLPYKYKILDFQKPLSKNLTR